jgi:hypothetical protein
MNRDFVLNNETHPDCVGTVASDVPCRRRAKLGLESKLDDQTMIG